MLICARSAEDLDTAKKQISSEAGGRVVAKTANIADERDVQKLVEHTQSSFGALDVLVCNAGVYGPKGSIDELDWESWVEAIFINLLGTVLCCRLFLPLLRNSQRGKIILLSGGGATKPRQSFANEVIRGVRAGRMSQSS